MVILFWIDWKRCIHSGLGAQINQWEGVMLRLQRGRWVRPEPAATGRADLRNKVKAIHNSQPISKTAVA